MDGERQSLRQSLVIRLVFGEFQDSSRQVIGRCRDCLKLLPFRGCSYPVAFAQKRRECRRRRFLGGRSLLLQGRDLVIIGYSQIRVERTPPVVAIRIRLADGLGPLDSRDNVRPQARRLEYQEYAGEFSSRGASGSEVRLKARFQVGL